MKILRRQILVFALLSICAGCDTTPNPYPGTLAGPGGQDRIIVIRPDTRTVAVVQRELVKFEVEATGKSFVWQFGDGSSRPVELQSVAPPGTLNQPVKVYVQERIIEG